MAFNLKVSGQKPDWKVNPEEFSNSMSLIGKVKINGYFSSDPEDLVAAFAGNKCVGLASPQYMKDYDAYYLFMNIYGDNTNSNLTFNVWDASTGLIYPTVVTDQIIEYQKDMFYGDIANPVILTVDDNILEHDFNLKAGWNWISYNVQSPYFNDFKKTFASVGDAAEIVKSSSQYKQQSTDGEWEGLLDSIEVGKMYSLKMKTAGTLKTVGVIVDPAKYPVKLNSGWNWIGFVPKQSMSVNDALAGLTATAGDVIKGQTEFAIYTTTNGWVGTLQTLNPGKGYMYKAAKTATFNYPAHIVSPMYAPMMFSMFAFNAMAETHWNFDATQYPSNMNVTAVLYKDGVECKNANYEIGAFDKNNVCRGNVVMQKGASNNIYYAYLTVVGEQSGEDLTLKAYNSAEAKEYAILQKISFTPDVILGTIDMPHTLSIGTLATANPVDNKVYTTGDVVESITFTGTSIPNTFYRWKQSGANVGLQTNSGVNTLPPFTAINAGLNPLVAHIIVTPVSVVGKDSIEGNPVSFTITINATVVNASGIQLNKTTTSLVKSREETLFASIVPANATNQNVTWTSSNTNIATVANGKVMAINVGNTYIVATSADGNFKDSCKVNVVSNAMSVSGILLNKANTSLVKGGEEILFAAVIPANATNQNISWTSSNTNIATVANGKVTAVNVGNTYIIVTSADGNFKDSCKVNVLSDVVAVTGIQLNKATNLSSI